MNIRQINNLLNHVFAVWFSGSSLNLGQYGTFVFSGLLSFFGGVDVALPFMIDLMRLPSDMYQLYVVTGVIGPDGCRHPGQPVVFQRDGQE